MALKFTLAISLFLLLSQSTFAQDSQSAASSGLPPNPPILCGTDPIAIQLSWTCVDGIWQANGDQIIDTSNSVDSRVFFSSPLAVNGSLTILSPNTIIVCSGYRVNTNEPLFNVTGNATLRGSLLIVLNSSATKINSYPYPILVGTFPTLIQPFDNVTVISSAPSCLSFDQSEPFYSNSKLEVLLEYASDSCGKKKMMWIIPLCVVLVVFVLVSLAVVVGCLWRRKGVAKWLFFARSQDV